jgi:hypothetical protein
MDQLHKPLPGLSDPKPFPSFFLPAFCLAPHNLPVQGGLLKVCWLCFALIEAANANDLLLFYFLIFGRIAF